MDPKGMIPPAVINQQAAHTVGAIVAMQEYVEKKYNGFSTVTRSPSDSY
jgi:hypothetical protein